MRNALEHVGLSFPDWKLQGPRIKGSRCSGKCFIPGSGGGRMTDSLLRVKTGQFHVFWSVFIQAISFLSVIQFCGIFPLPAHWLSLKLDFFLQRAFTCAPPDGLLWLTPASLLSKQEDYRTIEIKQRAKYDGEPGNGQGLSLMGLLHPFWWIMHELAWSCQPSWSASSYGSSDPNKEGTAVASWLLPQQASCLTSVFEKPYWSWAVIPWNCLLPATSSFVNPPNNHRAWK